MPNTIEEIEAALGEPQAEFVIVLGGGHELRCKSLNDATDILRIRRKAEETIEATKAPPAEWEPFLPADKNIIRSAVFMTELVIDPPVTILKALEWAKRRGPLFFEIAEQIATRVQADVSIAERAAINEEKKESEETGSTAE